MIFPMMDKDKDGRLSKAEVSDLAGMMGGASASPPDTGQTFAQMDLDGDGWVSRPEADRFFDMVSRMMGGLGGGASSATLSACSFSSSQCPSAPTSPSS